LWTTYFIEGWRTQENIFAKKFGQTKRTNKESERTNFTGIYKRSLERDEINDMWYSTQKRELTKIIGMLFCVILLTIPVYLCNLVFGWQ